MSDNVRICYVGIMLIAYLIEHTRHRMDLAPATRTALLYELRSLLRCVELAAAIEARQGGIYPFRHSSKSPHAQTVH